ncbi:MULTISPECIES: DUF4012 domain-containing protein [unclassified Microbacterium]|uniref:DUF4012 domain-containing protein n=1 Tax=unclassified Microbacterium TaxID=2609290 RepID=UPI00214B3852|nr:MULTISPECIES: DUF4012 domain-containing protein [unclassified Microbacterium]MCR2784784.1 DUF4012 domain-containing protein [Microbacterium sp. zg.B96]WIM16323.1 DUF4012 domain-containing protein [Microbacterium sp. zg-B96]
MAWVAFGVLVVFLAGAAWIGIRAALAYGHVRAAQAAVTDARSLLDDPASAVSVLSDISHHTAAARVLTSDPVWHVAARLPWLGAQLHAVGALTAALDESVSGALTPLAASVSQLDFADLGPRGGRIDAAPLAGIGPDAHRAAVRLDTALATVSQIDRRALVAPLRDALDEVAQLLTVAQGGADALARAGVLLPGMLGAEGPREYLLLFQNNAEWRSLGGVPGAMALVRVDDGRIELVAQESSPDYPRYREPVMPLGPEIEAVYGANPGRWIQNITQVPDFTIAAALAQEMWAEEHDGLRVDGVVSFDPVALSYLLSATGPITTATGDRLTATTVVDVLLRDSYLRFERPADQDAFFAAAGAAVFTAVTEGDLDPSRLLTALGRAAEERRLLVWSADAAEQAVLDETVLAGRLPRSDAETARFGVYLNDGTGSKMDYYQSAASSVHWRSCELAQTGGATGVAEISVTIKNNAPADAASLPRYITSGGKYGLDPGTVRTVAYLYLPPGFDLVDASVTGDVGFGGGVHDGHRVVSVSVDVVPGATATVTLAAHTRETSAPTLAVVSTPTIDPPPAEEAICQA